MKILYGVQGTGNGHIARARAMACALKERDVDVDFLFSGRDENKYFSMEEFRSYQTRKGVTFVTNKGKVDYFKTALAAASLPIIKEINNLDLSSYDLVLNDFEPITAWAAKRQQVPCIGISHQNAFRYAVPKKNHRWLDRKIIQHFAPSDFHIGLHWYHFGQPILPPIVHRNSHTIEQGKDVLVYLPFESVNEITDVLLGFTQTQFVCYHPDITEPSCLENIEFKKTSHSAFQKDLHRCQGVIANGGFELPSEALSIGKKLLLKPLTGQFEQESNVATLEHLGLAHSMDYLDSTAIRAWLDVSEAESVTYPDVAQSIVDWILKGHWTSSEQLQTELWQQVDFPSYALI
ncbi:glycosyltransferase family protein [Vibrio sp. TH_r3]|uniref:MJ1255/VC2487 family glycosyltransferase n=1 Tax=Vibrio sp. TH_r3 TaxID=3082084 RepID=UPI0029548905|nr:MJ1255/VC2487 family glycosyltransferase [Vibrio sp. TH_r3]MDV7105407.1 glycosyltransferase family protein [Vibrio sp. TH_r3]